MRQQISTQAGKSSLLYDTQFKAEYLKPRYFPIWLALLLLFILTLLPAFVQDHIANLLGDLQRKLNAKRRRFARLNLKLCFAELTDDEIKAMIKNNFRHQARSILYYGLIWWAPRWLLKKRIEINGLEQVDRSLHNGRSVIFMTAHSLGLEAAVSAVSMRYPMSGPFKPMKNKLVDWLVAKGRVRHGTLIYTRDAGLRPIIKDVRGGCTMFYLPDEDLGADRCIFSKFFGVEKATVPVLGRLAKSCNADVFPCIACYDERRHKYVVHVLPALAGYPQGDDEQDTLKMNQVLEELVRLCPSQYFWIMKLFKTRPEGEARFY